MTRTYLIGPAVALVLWLAVQPALAAAGQDATPAPTPSGSAATSSAPAPPAVVSDADLRRIRKALSSEPAVTISDDQLRYFVEILAKQPTFAEFVRGSDLINGPTRRGNPMTHQEFLAMVTPKEMSSSGGITATETLQFAITNWLGQLLIRRAIEEMKSAKDEREVQEIRDRISRELAALRRN